jgi:hypothetical protein
MHDNGKYMNISSLSRGAALDLKNEHRNTIREANPLNRRCALGFASRIASSGMMNKPTAPWAGGGTSHSGSSGES